MIISAKTKKRLTKINPKLLYHIETKLSNSTKITLKEDQISALVFVYFDQLIRTDVICLQTSSADMCLYYKDNQIIVRYEFQ